MSGGQAGRGFRVTKQHGAARLVSSLSGLKISDDEIDAVNAGDRVKLETGETVERIQDGEADPRAAIRTALKYLSPTIGRAQKDCDAIAQAIKALSEAA